MKPHLLIVLAISILTAGCVTTELGEFFGSLAPEPKPKSELAVPAPAEPAPAASTNAGSDGEYGYRCTRKVKKKAASRDMGCDYGRRNGFLRIYLEDGTEYALEPVGDKPGNFRDTSRNVSVNRKFGPSNKSVIFDYPTETISVSW